MQVAPLKRRLPMNRPLAYLDRPSVRWFRKVFGPLYPPYFGLGVLFGFFSFLAFFAVHYELLPSVPLATSSVLGTGTGLLLYFADDTLMPIPADLAPQEWAAFRRRIRTASLLIVLGCFAVLGTFFVFGPLGFYNTVGFLFFGFSMSSLWVFVSSKALPCATCEAVGLFRTYRGRFVCTRCGSGP